MKIISVPIGLKNLYSVDTKYRGEVLSPMYQKEEKVTFWEKLCVQKVS